MNGKFTMGWSLRNRSPSWSAVAVTPLSNMTGAGREAGARAFTLIEVMVAMALLTLIVIALMAVFNSTQKAFRASVTQTDVLEGGRIVMSMMADDLRGAAPSWGQSNFYAGAVNFYVNTNAYSTSYPAPLEQSLAPGDTVRANALEGFFVLHHQNLDWSGVGYAVAPRAPDGGLYALYRFEYPSNGAPVNAGRINPGFIFTNQFQKFLNAPTNDVPGYSRLMDGVVDLTIRAYDIHGVLMTNNYLLNPISAANAITTNRNAYYFPPTQALASGVEGFETFSNTLPASVEIEMGVLEDRALQRAESLGGIARSNYLWGQAGAVHVFRERVSIPNMDPAAYQ
ncbi:MAG: prepilin-type N-terminal cleavage/methylation domain-containing protein [Verrucomicrobia bacterium]|nr:prepilin-type N-terminal cleavage/methylation domain-containing protein [Verrucomicrobiota bacterium]MDE3099768.1 prepilin-type N-terminal cleavage/methylation domain-containing protein [Verrucomicrobiota bacterium]